LIIIQYKKNHFDDLLNKVSHQLNLPKSLTENYNHHNIIYTDHSNGEKCNNCATCLGVLQIADHQDHIEDVAKKVLKEDFEFKSFKFTIKIPLSTGIRLAQVLKNRLYIICHFRWHISFIKKSRMKSFIKMKS